MSISRPISRRSRSPWPLRYTADLRTLMFVGAFNVLLAVQWLHIARGAGFALLTYLLAVVTLVVKHNHMHSPTFRRLAWNSAFEVWLSVLTAHPCSGIITSHNVLHHGKNNTEADFVRCSLVRYRSNLLNFLAFFFASVAAMYRNKPADLHAWRQAKPGLYLQAVVERILTYGSILLLLVLDWRATLTYCLGPWLFGQWFLVTINLLQHQDCDFESPINHSRNITGRFANWLLLNNGYHTAHHMFPSAHWSKLGIIHERVIAPRLASALDERSLWLCIWRRFILGRGWKGARA
jgi:fatty acid desaturase